MTLYEWIGRWMEGDIRPKVRPSTYATKRYVLQNHIYPKLGDVRLNELTEARIGAFLDERKRGGGSRPECPDYPGLSDVTMRHIHRLLKECLDHAVEAGLMANNPARAFHYDTQRKAKVTALSENEIDAYLDAAEELGHLPMFTLMLTAGLRQRELLALTPETAALLCQEHAKHPSAELMFIHPDTRKPYLPTMVRLLHQKILDKAGLEPCRFDDFRHTFSTTALEHGMDVKTLSALLGNVSSATTLNIYTHITDNMRQDAAAKIGKAEPEDTNKGRAKEEPSKAMTTFQPYQLVEKVFSTS